MNKHSVASRALDGVRLIGFASNDNGHLTLVEREKSAVFSLIVQRMRQIEVPNDKTTLHLFRFIGIETGDKSGVDDFGLLYLELMRQDISQGENRMSVRPEQLILWLALEFHLTNHPLVLGSQRLRFVNLRRLGRNVIVRSRKKIFYFVNQIHLIKTEKVKTNL